jgi:proteasome lid subunit RPN8/RPN11
MKMNADSALSGSKFNSNETKITLSPSSLSAMEAHAVSTYPEECCGLLLGAFENGQKSKKIQEPKPMSNVFEKKERYHRFTIDPKDFMKAETDAESRGLEIVGIYHSHPNAPAKPSEFDRAHAWPSLSYLVMEVRDKKVMETKSWILKDDRSEFVPEEIVME